VGDSIAFFSELPKLGENTIFDTALSNIFIPAGVELAFFALAASLTQLFIKRNSPFMQAITMCSFTIAICYYLVYTHDGLHSIYAVLAFPLLVSLVYIDRKPLFFSLISCMIMFVSFEAIILPRRAGLEDSVLASREVVATLLFLVASYIACNSILLVISRVVNTMIVKDEELKLDSFTGLLNHTAFYERQEKLIAEHLKHGSRFTLVIWDVDNFQDVNDNYGHETGDKVLLRFAEILKKIIGPNDFAFRYGGDEFALLIRRNAKETYSMALKIRELFYETVRRLNLDVQVTVSAGLCEYDHSLFFGSKEFFHATDSALYAAKGSENKDLIVSVHTPVWEEDLVEYQTKRAAF
jgi:two-component system cell cycle response regulator